MISIKHAILFFGLLAATPQLNASPDSTEPVRQQIFSKDFFRKFQFSVETIDLNFMGTGRRLVGRSLVATAGMTAKGRPVNMHFFQGKSDRKALVIGGVHGTELSAIEVAYELINKLNNTTDTPEFSVLIIPELFPDNAAAARQDPSTIGSADNIGRYTHAAAADPNRQMPALGKAFNDSVPYDALGREIEFENRILLSVIRDYAPERIVNLHAIRDVKFAGVFADPRTDEKLLAHGFEKDSILAIDMAKYIAANGSSPAGNKLETRPNALYLHDPAIAAMGTYQKRNVSGSCLNGGRGKGVSLGGWAATAVNDECLPNLARPALTIITMEFPGCKRPQDYLDPLQISSTARMVNAYAGSILQVFLN